MDYDGSSYGNHKNRYRRSSKLHLSEVGRFRETMSTHTFVNCYTIQSNWRSKLCLLEIASGYENTASTNVMNNSKVDTLSEFFEMTQNLKRKICQRSGQGEPATVNAVVPICSYDGYPQSYEETISKKFVLKFLCPIQKKNNQRPLTLKAFRLSLPNKNLLSGFKIIFAFGSSCFSHTRLLPIFAILQVQWAEWELAVLYLK